MSRPRFLADHNLKSNIVEGVLSGEPSIEFFTAFDLGAARLSDPDLLDVAARDRLLIVSHDKKTLVGHAYARFGAGKLMCGLFVVDMLDPIGPAIDSLLLIALASEAEEWEGRVLFLPL